MKKESNKKWVKKYCPFCNNKHWVMEYTDAENMTYTRCQGFTDEEMQLYYETNPN